MYERISDVKEVTGTCGATECALPPLKLVDKFGNPEDGDGYKTSGEYWFKDSQTGIVFTVYDWKSTSLYEYDLMEPSEFWENSFDMDFMIGTSGPMDSSVTDFRDWLISQVRNGPVTAHE